MERTSYKLNSRPSMYAGFWMYINRPITPLATTATILQKLTDTISAKFESRVKKDHHRSECTEEKYEIPANTLNARNGAKTCIFS